MKRVIDGKLYNTETATKIGSYWNGLSTSDFRRVSEELYRTKSGNYFLAGTGGPLTPYAESNGESSWGSSRIIPLSKEEAFEWVQQHLRLQRELRLSTDEVLKEFPDMIEEA